MKHKKGLSPVRGIEATTGAKKGFGLGMTVAAVMTSAAIATMPTPTDTISNQASATYRDSQNNPQNTQSNVVETAVLPVYGVDISDPLTKTSAKNRSVNLPFSVQNLSNTSDTLELDFDNSATDQFDCDSMTLFAADPDNLTVPTGAALAGPAASLQDIVLTPDFASLDTRHYVWVCDVPGGALVDNDQAVVDITVTSQTDGAAVDQITQTVQILSGNVEVTKQFIDLTTGEILRNGLATGNGDNDANDAGETAIGVHLRFVNTGDSTGNVTIVDELPSMMSYVTASGRMNTLGGAVLLDADGGVNPDFTNGAQEVFYHFDDAQGPEGQLTVSISNIAPSSTGDGTSTGNVYFGVTMDQFDLGAASGGITNAETAGTVVQAGDYENVAVYSVNGGPDQQAPAIFTVDPNVSILLDDRDDEGNEVVVDYGNGNICSDDDNTDNDDVNQASAAAGSFVYFCNILTNTGNTVENVTIELGDLTTDFPPNTVATMLTEGGAVIDNGKIEVDPGETRVVVVQLTLPNDAPAGTNGGNGYSVTKTATASTDPSVSDSVNDVLDEIIANSVDLTNNLALGDANCDSAGDSATCGFGNAAPNGEANAVTTETIVPGQTATFTLFVNVPASSPGGANYSLQMSSDNNFADGVDQLPQGWEGLFKVNGVIVEQVFVSPGQSVEVIAEITVPSVTEAAAGDVIAPNGPAGQSIYFRISDTAGSGTEDVKHDAIVIDLVRLLDLQTNGESTVVAGACAAYKHTLTNLGNETEGDGVYSTFSVSVVDDHAGIGQPFDDAVLYFDSNDSGELEPNIDLVLTNPAQLTDGWAPGETRTLFVYSCAKNGEAPGQENTSTISVTTINNAATAPVPADVANEDLTRIVGVELVKFQQVVDSDFTGQISEGGSNGDLTCNAPVAANWTKEDVSATPGQCVCYLVTVTNQEADPITDLLVTDATPDFTTIDYCGANCDPAVISDVDSAPADGQAGSLQLRRGFAPAAPVQANEQFDIQFCVEIDRY